MYAKNPPIMAQSPFLSLLQNTFEYLSLLLAMQYSANKLLKTKYFMIDYGTKYKCADSSVVHENCFDWVVKVNNHNCTFNYILVPIVQHIGTNKINNLYSLTCKVFVLDHLSDPFLCLRPLF